MISTYVLEEYISHMQMEKYQRLHRIYWENSRFEMYVLVSDNRAGGRYIIQPPKQSETGVSGRWTIRTPWTVNNQFVLDRASDELG